MKTWSEVLVAALVKARSGLRMENPRFDKRGYSESGYDENEHAG